MTLVIDYNNHINCPTRWCPSGLTPTHHQFGEVSGTGGEHTKVVPAHVGLGRREERGRGCRTTDLTGLYPIAAAALIIHALGIYCRFLRFFSSCIHSDIC